jgi:hypothetical protein
MIGRYYPSPAQATSRGLAAVEMRERQPATNLLSFQAELFYVKSLRSLFRFETALSRLDWNNAQSDRRKSRANLRQQTDPYSFRSE